MLTAQPEKAGLAMINSYRVIPSDGHMWAIEWFVDDVSQGVLVGRYQDKAEALFVVFELARQEFREGVRTDGSSGT